jgi:hypothetical protein
MCHSARPLKENAPTNKSDNRRLSQIPVKELKRESLASQCVAHNSHYLGQGNALGQSKHPTGTTATTTLKRGSTHISVQTPQPTKRIANIKTQAQPQPKPDSSTRSSNGNPIVQPRLMGPVQPSILPLADSSMQPTLSRASTEKDLRKINLRASSRLSGISSSALATTKNEVRIPRSSTFHYIPTYRETPPPVPPIPQHFGTPQKPRGVNLAGDWLGNSCTRTPLARLSQPRFKQTTPTEAEIEKNERRRRSSTFVTNPDSRGDTSSDDDLLTALPTLPSKPGTGAKPSRPFCANKKIGSRANTGAFLQVKEYMPPLWWAGRFQTRFDQWRHEAMKLELDPRYTPEGLLGQYRMSQEKIAACYIFLQLRDLCTTNKAADSLWVCGKKPCRLNTKCCVGV